MGKFSVLAHLVHWRNIEAENNVFTVIHTSSTSSEWNIVVCHFLESDWHGTLNIPNFFFFIQFFYQLFQQSTFSSN